MKKIFEVNNQSKILMFIKWTKENESGQKFDLQYYVKYGIIKLYSGTTKIFKEVIHHDKYNQNP